MAALFFLLINFVAPASLLAQKPPREINAIGLKKKVDEAETAFMKTAAEVAREYEQAGELEMAQEVLRKILKLQPDLKKVKEKIKELEEERLAKNEASLEIDSSKGWIPAGVTVKKGNKVRFLSDGEYRIVISQRVDSEGFSTKDVKQDLAASVPLGALMGVIVNRKGKTSSPFLIGKKSEIAVSLEGQLLIRVNVPPGSKCTGKVRVKISGEIQTASQGNSGK